MKVFNNRVNLLVKDQRGHKTWYYVFLYLDAHTEWNYTHIKKLIKMGGNKRTQDYTKALVIAHRHIVCEFGVQIMCLKQRSDYSKSSYENDGFVNLSNVSFPHVM